MNGVIVPSTALGPWEGLGDGAPVSYSSDNASIFAGIKDLLNTGMQSYSMWQQYRQGRIAVDPNTGRVYEPGKETVNGNPITTTGASIAPYLLLAGVGVVLLLILKD
ncbi:hypothetical protein [Chitinilyticum aquatile]|uniref:hypothetical protein n=1 Tax=Chitinilyticum aquatile TaxID=362520 RepID=UPI000400B293|nr:hypothetical protein [Chitinilyticum aquatile]